MNKNDKRKEIMYQKTDYNSHLICQFSTIFKCCKCKRNNNIIEPQTNFSQSCLFCGTPNYVKRERKY
jgi:hypothetical protein